jgi:translin
MNLGIKEIEKTLMKKEKEMDTVLSKNRTVIRACSNSIKAIHSDDMKKAKKYLKEAEKELSGIRKYQKEFPAQLNHVLQEYAEARIVLSAVEKGKIPSHRELKVGEISYLNGLLDSIGELKREMYESLRHGKRKKAVQYFEMMEGVYDELLPLRFSSSVLPEFRRKQDVARLQIEQARGELLR